MRTTALLLPVLAALSSTTSASPRPAMNPDSLFTMANDAAQWSLSSLTRDNDRVGTLTTWKMENCGLSSDAIQLESLTVDPDPPKPGKTLTITASGTVNSKIEAGAYADVTVKLGPYIKLLQKRFDVCEELDKANSTLQCPIEPGHYKVVQSVDLPREIPPAKFTVQVRAYTQDEEDMACTNIVIDFLAPDKLD